LQGKKGGGVKKDIETETKVVLLEEETGEI
jgi:hypothetical protein